MRTSRSTAVQTSTVCINLCSDEDVSDAEVVHAECVDAAIPRVDPRIVYMYHVHVHRFCPPTPLSFRTPVEDVSNASM